MKENVPEDYDMKLLWNGGLSDVFSGLENFLFCFSSYSKQWYKLTELLRSNGEDLLYY